MAKLNWRISYETYKFDTPDGDLDVGEYAKVENNFAVRRHPKNNWNIVIVKKLNPNVDKKEVAIVQGENMYYDEFELPDKRILRMPSNKTLYNNLAKKNAKALTKELSDAEIQKIKDDDKSFPNIPISDTTVEKKFIQGGIRNDSA